MGKFVSSLKQRETINTYKKSNSLSHGDREAEASEKTSEKRFSGRWKMFGAYCPGHAVQKNFLLKIGRLRGFCNRGSHFQKIRL